MTESQNLRSQIICDPSATELNANPVVGVGLDEGLVAFLTRPGKQSVNGIFFRAPSSLRRRRSSPSDGLLRKSGFSPPVPAVAAVAAAAAVDEAEAVLLRGRNQVVGEIFREVEPFQFDVDEVHGEGELVRVQHPVVVDVREAPDLGQDRVGETGLNHLLLGRRAGDLAVDGAELPEVVNGRVE